MAPPMKRMRGDWDDRPRYGHDYYGGGGNGGGGSWGPDHYPQHHGNHHYGNHNNTSRLVYFSLELVFFSLIQTNLVWRKNFTLLRIDYLMN